MKRFLLSLVALTFLTCSANAATCFWVGGTGTWDNSTDAANWSVGSGGAGNDCGATGGVPKNAGDIAVFDAASGGGTVTNNVDINIAQITIGAFTGTLDFATNDRNVTLTTAMSLTGAGTKTLNMGDGTWTLTATTGTVWDCGTCANLTLNANGSTINLAATGTATRIFSSGSKTYNNLNITTTATSYAKVRITGFGTFTNWVFNANTRYVEIGSSLTVASITFDCATGAPCQLISDGVLSSNNTITMSGATTTSWLSIGGITRAGAGSWTSNNSFGVSTSGITVNQPSGGGGIIGG